MAEANLTYTLAVDDTSPTLAYTPFADNFSPPSYDTGWNPAYTDGASYSVFPDPVTAQGSGASIHVTSANNASVTLRWNGTGVALYGYFPPDSSTVPSSLSYSISLDGTSTTNYASSITGSDPTQSVLAAFTNLTDTEHSIVLTMHNPDGLSHPDFVLQFDRAEINGTVPQPPSEESSTTGLTDEMLPDDSISYRGQWSFETDVIPGQSLSFHASSNAGDRASVQFNGTSVALSGLTTPLSGSYNISLDHGTPETLSARSTFNLTAPTLLFFRTGLDPHAPHQLEVTNVGASSGGQGSLLVLSGVNVTLVAQGSNGTSPPSQMPPHTTRLAGGTIAAIAVVASVACIVLLVLAAIYFRKRRREMKRKQSFIVNPRLKTRRFSFMRPRSRQTQRGDSEKEQTPKTDPRRRSTDPSILEIGGARKDYTDDEEDEGNERTMLTPPAPQHSRHGSQNSDGSFSINLPELPHPGRGHLRMRSDSPTDTLRFAPVGQTDAAMSPTMSYTATSPRSSRPRGPREMRGSTIGREGTKSILLKEMYVPNADVPVDVQEEGSQGSGGNNAAVPYLPQPYVSPLRVNFDDETQQEAERKAKRERTRSAVSGISLPASLRQALGWSSHPFAQREPSPDPERQMSERQPRQLARHSFLDMDSSASQSLSSGSRSTRQSQTSSKSREHTTDDHNSMYTTADAPSIPQHFYPHDHDPSSPDNDRYELPRGDRRVSLGFSMTVAGGPTSSRPSLSPNVSLQAVPLPPLTVPPHPQSQPPLDVPESAHTAYPSARPYSPTHPGLPEASTQPATAPLTHPIEFLPSPTDSVPLTVSDIHFRHSTQSSTLTTDSQSHGHGTQGHSTHAQHGHSSHGHSTSRQPLQRATHPPLPGPDERPYIIQKIVGTAGAGSGPTTPFGTPTMTSATPASAPSSTSTFAASRSGSLGAASGSTITGVPGGRGSPPSGPRRAATTQGSSAAGPSSARGGRGTGGTRSHNPMMSFSSLMSRPKTTQQ